MDFYSSFRDLVRAKPQLHLQLRTSENCVGSDYLFQCKNAYLSSFLSETQDAYYSEYLYKSRDCVDCNFVSGGELCYECVDCSSLYNCSFLQDCHNCSHCDFSLDCINCKDCFGCFGLRQQRFCIFNRSYSEEVYREKVAQLKKNSPQKILEILKPEFEKHPRLYARMLKGGESCFGDYIYYSKNCFSCFNVRNVTDSAYIYESLSTDSAVSDCYDCNYCYNLSGCYECLNSSNSSSCNFLMNSMNCSESEYLISCHNCQNCFGCVYLNNKQYCILNKQFTREEYEFAVRKIKEDLKQGALYGKNFAEILSY